MLSLVLNILKPEAYCGSYSTTENSARDGFGDLSQLVMARDSVKNEYNISFIILTKVKKTLEIAITLGGKLLYLHCREMEYLHFGVYLSPVECTSGGRVVASSNLVTPTTKRPNNQQIIRSFCFMHLFSLKSNQIYCEINHFRMISEISYSFVL